MLYSAQIKKHSNCTIYCDFVWFGTWFEIN